MLNILAESFGFGFSTRSVWRTTYCVGLVRLRLKWWIITSPIVWQYLNLPVLDLGASVSVVSHSLLIAGPLLTSSSTTLVDCLTLVMTNIDDESDAAWESFPTCISSRQTRHLSEEWWRGWTTPYLLYTWCVNIVLAYCCHGATLMINRIRTRSESR